MLIPILLLLIGIIAIIVEFFVPAFGIVGILGGGGIIASIIIVYRQKGPVLGSIFLIVAIIVIPVLIFLYFKVFPRSFLGKRLIQQDSQKQNEGYTSYTQENYIDLPGKPGISLTPLRPSGMALIDEKRYSVVTSGEFIEKEQPLRVHRVEGSRIIVKRGE